MEEDYEKGKKSLLDSFAAALTKKSADRPWFDEDDLVDIFDFAGDDGNDYLRAEALIWGAHAFPDSEALLSRRAVFYSNFVSQQAVESLLKDNPSQKSLLADLLLLRAGNLTPGQIRTALNNLLDKYETFDDEEAIQLVDLAADSKNIDWIILNLKELKEKAEYKPGLLYEAASEAYEAGYYKSSRAFTEELLKDAPYAADFWLMLAQNQLALSAFEEARTAADMALAINPESIEALQIKIESLANDLSPEADAIRQEIFDKNKSDERIAMAWLIAKLDEHDPADELGEDVINTIIELNKKFPENSQLFLFAMQYAPEKAYEIAHSQIFNSIETGVAQVDDWLRVIESLIEIGAIKGSLMLVTILQKMAMVPELLGKCVHTESELRFSLEQWDNALHAAEKFNSIVNATTCVMDIIKLKSLMNLNRKQEARALASAIISKTGYQIKAMFLHPMSQQLQREGLNQMAKEILDETT